MSGVSDVFAVMDPAPVPPVRSPRIPPPASAAAAPSGDNSVLPPKRFKLLTGEDLAAMPRLRWAVRNVLPSAGVAALYGASTTGKSFLALDLAAAIAEGRDWFGHRVKQPRRVVYVVLEGEAGFRIRVQAWEQANGRQFPTNVRFVFQSFEIGELPDILALWDAIDTEAATNEPGNAPVIIIDTLNRSAPSADENSSADMGRILEGVRSLQDLTEGLVLLVHHVGKDATKGMRGHSSLFAALDAAIEVTRADDRREWKVAKAKDGEDGQTHPFRLSVIELDDDEDGEPVSSCIVQPDDDERVSARPKLPKGGNQRIVYEALGQLFRESHTFGKAGAPAIRPCIRLDAAIGHARDRLTCPTDRRTERTRQALTGLIGSGVMGCNEDWIWLI